MRGLWTALTVLAIAVSPAPLHAEARLKVVASFSILADFVSEIGGERVEVTSLVGPDGDVHVYAPAPHDAKAVAEARLLVINGLGLEGWLPRLLQSSGSRPAVVTASQGVAPLRLGSGPDPHAWQSVANAKVYVRNIRDAMIAADAADAGDFRTNADRYLTELDELDRDVRHDVDLIPPERRKVISTHRAFAYFADAYGIEFIAPVGLSTETEPSARDVAAIIEQVKRQSIPAVFLENINDDRLMRQIAQETGARLGGTLYSDSLTGQNGPAPTYIAMVRHNIRALVAGLGR